MTNLVSGTPTIGAKAYYDNTGHLQSQVAVGPQVGRFLSTKDADSYCKIEINII